MYIYIHVYKYIYYRLPSGNVTWLNKCNLWWVIHLDSINGSFPLRKKSTSWKKTTHDPTFAKSAKSLPHRWAHSAPSSVYCGTWPMQNSMIYRHPTWSFYAMAAMSAYQKVCRKIGKSNPMTTQTIDDAIIILRMFNQNALSILHFLRASWPAGTSSWNPEWK